MCTTVVRVVYILKLMTFDLYRTLMCELNVTCAFCSV